MSEKPYKVFDRNDCIELWNLVNRWKSIPKKELERLINDEVLPLYKNITPAHVYENSNKIYLEKYVILNKVFFTSNTDGDNKQFCQVIYYDELMFQTLETEKHEGFIYDIYIPRFYFLLADVKELEQQNPEYIDINKVKISKTPAKPTIAELQAEIESLKATIERYEAEKQQQIATPTNKELDNFFKAYPVIKGIYAMHNEGLENEEIRDILTNKDGPYKLTALQAGGLTRKNIGNITTNGAMKKQIERWRRDHKQDDED